MPTVTVNFLRMIQDSQDYGSDDDHMVSRVFFTLTIDGTAPVSAYVNVKQTVGSNFDTAPLEVSAPVGYAGPGNHHALRVAVENYYRSLVGSKGSEIHFSGNVKGLRMRNNTFVMPATVTIEVGGDGPAW